MGLLNGMPQLDRARLAWILDKIGSIRVGVIGDGALDVYWRADMTRSELSRETPHYPLPVVEERFTLGAAANVAMNAKALGAHTVSLLTVAGEDWRGRELAALLQENGIDASYLIRSRSRITPAYIKPLRQGYGPVVYEDPRLDFANHAPLPSAEEASVIDGLGRLAAASDIIAVADQFALGIITAGVRAKLAPVYDECPVVADSRSHIGEFRGVIVKPNDLEAARAVHAEQQTPPNRQDIPCLANALRRRTGKPVIITLGEEGALWADGEDTVLVSACKVEPPLDIVGAGDAFLAAFCCAYAAGAAGPEALALANLASGVVVGKIGTTGTAAPEEILAMYDRQRSGC